MTKMMSMTKLTSSLYAAMSEVLGQIATTSENTLQVAERSYHTVKSTLQEVKDYIIGYDFKDEAEEILFFKEIKPQFLTELIYYQKLFYIEAEQPLGDKESLTAYYKQAIDRINTFLQNNHVLYIYYRMSRSDHDRLYFVRTSERHDLLPEYSLDIDPRFTTIYSYKFAKIQAYERLNDYLQQAIYLTEHPYTEVFAGEKKKGRNLWTDTKSALIELAYAIHSRGAVNHGKGNVKQIIADLEMVFNVSVGNFHRTFQSMRIRKKGRTPFLDTLKESLEKRMDDTDLNYS